MLPFIFTCVALIGRSSRPEKGGTCEDTVDDKEVSMAPAPGELKEGEKCVPHTKAGHASCSGDLVCAKYKGEFAPTSSGRKYMSYFGGESDFICSKVKKISKGGECWQPVPGFSRIDSDARHMDASCEGDLVCARNWMDFQVSGGFIESRLTPVRNFQDEHRMTRRFGCKDKHCCSEVVKLKENEPCGQEQAEVEVNDEVRDQIYRYMDDSCDGELVCAKKGYKYRNGFERSFGGKTEHICSRVPEGEKKKEEEKPSWNSSIYGSPTWKALKERLWKALKPKGYGDGVSKVYSKSELPGAEAGKTIEVSHPDYPGIVMNVVVPENFEDKLEIRFPNEALMQKAQEKDA
jgi:hypothetical protein